jgi:lipopolysaccharide/colanic/teichoic acid biosynthesis glycosyltransferase
MNVIKATVELPAQRLSTSWQVRTKRTADVVLSVLLILCFIPLMLLAAMLIAVDSPGGILSRQRRLGRDMQGFTVFKFRTMRAEASPELHRLFVAELCRDEGQLLDDDSVKKLTHDPRVTRVGRVLRALSIDELPQLFNVLLGEMSLVGPRPALEYELEHYQQDHFARFNVRPGLTGLWQVSGRNLLGFTEMLELDAEYANEASLSTDLKILARTPLAAFRHAA